MKSYDELKAEMETIQQQMTEAKKPRKIRVIVAKIGFDGHDRGARVIARGLQEDGMEVIYAGLRQTAEAIVRAAVQEDVDAIGVSLLSGAHMTLIPRILKELSSKDAGVPPTEAQLATVWDAYDKNKDGILVCVCGCVAH